MMRPRSWSPMLFAAGLALAVACGGGETDEEPASADTTTVAETGVEVTGVTLGTSIGADKRVTGETDTFVPSDTIYASVETEGVAAGARLTAHWTYEDGQTIDQTSRTIAPNGPEVTEFHISKSDGWPTGGYEVAILLDGQETERASFQVEAAN